MDEKKKDKSKKVKKWIKYILNWYWHIVSTFFVFYLKKNILLWGAGGRTKNCIFVKNNAVNNWQKLFFNKIFFNLYGFLVNM